MLIGLYGKTKNQMLEHLKYKLKLTAFAMWGIDMIGEIRPIASNGHRFILVAIDYFMKWVEAASFATVTDRKSVV